ncbi:MAG: hypothetical protein K1X78_14190 [Verrucomicrobiaceae bacterium]|nr:hypothetical protein [Verrucomicrobiaceae bacterium]
MNQKSCLTLIGIAAAVALLGIGILVFLAWRAGPEKSIQEWLATLPAAERAALDAVCTAAGVEAAQLRPLGMLTDGLMRDARNAKSVVIRDGHVRALCLANSAFASAPDLSRLTEIELLWLENGNLTEWPVVSSLTRLRELQLGGQKLGTPTANTLPASLKKLGLARSNVSSIDPLISLALDEVDLSHTPVAVLPAAVPEKGGWQMDLDDTAITNPPGYRRQAPQQASLSGPTLPGGRIEGMASNGAVDVKVTGASLEKLMTVVLPTNTTTYHSSGPVEVECRIGSGRMRVWLWEPDGLFKGPWFERGKIRGFGPTHVNGFMTADVAAGQPAAARGVLIVQGTPPHHSFCLMLEPLEGGKVTDVTLRIGSAKQR